jgi:hypothetical protein
MVSCPIVGAMPEVDDVHYPWRIKLCIVMTLKFLLLQHVCDIGFAKKLWEMEWRASTK